MKKHISNTKTHFKKAFTMLELIFVIVIMGILAKFGVEFLAQAYNSFIFSKINNELQSNSASAVEFISKRLEHRIKDSVIVRNTDTNTKNPLVDSEDENATVLEWIASDIDGFRGDSDPYWSGIIDIDDGNASTLVTKGTDTTKTNSLINILSYGDSDINDSAIYFVGSSHITTNPWGYDGNITDQYQTMHPIRSAVQSNTFIPTNGNSGADNSFTGGGRIYEYYKPAWTAYAVRLDYNHTTNSGDLWLHYDYQPWRGDTYLLHSDGVTPTKSQLIMQNVSSFQFRAVGSLIKIQVCTKSLLTNEEYSICKEKTIF